jgi:hypothetical protein
MPTTPAATAAATTNETTVTVTPVTEAPAEGATPETFETWLETQDEKVKGLIGNRFTALESTVKATRGERDELAKEIKTLAKAQAEGSDARKSLDELSAKFEQTERRADFMEEAIKPEIQCRNPRAAWLLAQAEGHFDKSGRPNWTAIRAEAPELFGAPTANANAGAGTQQKPAAASSMNDFIRSKGGSVTQ